MDYRKKWGEPGSVGKGLLKQEEGGGSCHEEGRVQRVDGRGAPGVPATWEETDHQKFLF